MGDRAYALGQPGTHHTEQGSSQLRPQRGTRLDCLRAGLWAALGAVAVRSSSEELRRGHSSPRHPPPDWSHDTPCGKGGCTGFPSSRTETGRMRTVSNGPVVPVFIFSLPRTGSTLLQRLLAAHPEVSTTAEPWILLPLFYGRRERGAVAEYGHRSQVRALEDFLQHLPRGDADIDEAIRTYALALYQKAASPGSRYFIDKTPRYHLIAEDIIRVFGDSARYLFLWRNPLAVVSSIVATWGGGRWKFNPYYVDLFDGLVALTDVYQRRASLAHALTYEGLVNDPQRELAACLQHIGLDPDDELVDRLSTVRLDGRMGDPTGVERFSSVSTQSLDSWKTVLVGPYRRAWSRHYLTWIGPERLRVMGYDSAHLLRELASTQNLSIGQASDVWYHAIGLAKHYLRTHLVSRLG